MARPHPPNDEKEPFPWHLGVYDAHCHPTDTMSSIPSLPSMKTRILTVMATRAQDQALVSRVANTHMLRSSDPAKWSREECVVPCFGWHPWFSYQMYLPEEDGENGGDEERGDLTGDEKIAHYQSILRPRPPSDSPIFASLPNPKPFSTFLSATKAHLEHYPYALIGEIGLDRSFRIPEPEPETKGEGQRDDGLGLTPGGREGRQLSPYRVDLAHQRRIVKEQLKLAAKMGRAVSMHGVQAHGAVFEVLREMCVGFEKRIVSRRERKKMGQKQEPGETEDGVKVVSENERKPMPYPPRICLHSYSGNVSNWKQYLDPAIPIDMFASFSTAINLSNDLDGETPKSFEEIVKSVPDHMLLVESDLHTAGEQMDQRIEDIVRRICKVKEWNLEEGVTILGKNWRRFAFGTTE
ncbi:cut9 interacting protein-like protein Scn1 [Lophiostoma macrostomum CBS 122681]|uniref:Cut9 interacting protein-like protein Scn1 n=1 Tax=Lophiostoma macrostomum CBS 122681 TaxID=1314788 RepID=A0A6A6SMA1_9PLEO|nr:cut9 interacting protein-like protein Scn1 [Lophiostoma macrostomum CBS 122681]